MKDISLEELLEAGCHFGHKADRWHPKAERFIFTEKDGIHIIDLSKTRAALEESRTKIRDTVADGGEVLFLGTKRQAKGVVESEAKRVGAPYLVNRWIGGFLTNWESIKKNIDKINKMQEDKDTGAWKKFPKHEQYKLDRYLNRLKTLYEGVLTQKNLPDMLFVVDVRKEQTAVKEALRSSVATIAIVDTNSNPDTVTYPIPSNDDAVGAIQYITRTLADAYQEGKENAAKLEKKDAQKAEAPMAVDHPKTEQTTKEPDAKAAETKPKKPKQPVKPKPSKDSPKTVKKIQTAKKNTASNSKKIDKK